ncbi:pentatricopeptide repeat-containing protein At5g39350-like [Zingiber officinale]|uniref:Pentatricopeptide repeat-containing protein n=1 Tax=Zingiber officinale TaxID=94328 RepID=A0A8J5ETH7_ZINOF|nr:pentatricopeptide repeat-containing protein At5g39350-like [Zingiber officinale]KAG6474878.1 hypothetical protein ZIOFF_064094 [Zingiber officinale]
MNGRIVKHSRLRCLLADPTRCLSLVRSKSPLAVAQIHALLISSGTLSVDSPPSHLRPILSRIAVLYSLSGRLSAARHLFDRISNPNLHLWNALIRGHAQRGGLPFEALRFFARMVSSSLHPDHFTFPFALKACADLSLARLGAQIHGKSLASGFAGDDYVQNCLIAMYMSCADTDAAAKVFLLMNHRTVIAWNTMISGFCRNEYAGKALEVFDGMMDAGVEIDAATTVCVLPACAQTGDLQRGRLVHQVAGERGLLDARVQNSLVDMYAKCGCLEEARQVFDGMPNRDVIGWTAMIGAYALHGFEAEALSLSHLMQEEGVRPNSVTMASLLSACSAWPSLAHGKCIHGSCIRLCLESDIAVETALIDMYAKSRNMDLCHRVFATRAKRTATWNAMISGFARNSAAKDAVEHFKLMLAESVPVDLATIASLLPACADLADSKLASSLHCYLTRMGFTASNEAITGLVDIYAKAGKLDVAWELFSSLQNKDLVSWTAIIAGYGMHGHAITAIRLFDRMVESQVAPSEVTFTSLLYSCSHAGLVDEGLKLFNRMLHVHGVKQNTDHYACMIDLLGRAGRLQEAYDLIQGMPFQPNHAVWGALLGACVIHGNVELGELAAKHLFEIEPENTGNYVLLGNIYAAAGRWEDVESVRGLMTGRGLKKAPGSSLIEAKVL